MTSPLALHSLHFAHPGNDAAVFLRDEKTDQLLGSAPEWVAGGRSEPAAFVGGAQPTVQAVLAAGAEHPPDGNAQIVARDATGAVAVGPQRVALRFGADGRSSPVDLQLARPLPTGADVLSVDWDWSAESESGRVSLGRSRHEIFVTREQVVPAALWLDGTKVEPPAQHGQPEVERWAYRRVVEWTCRWTVGRETDRAVCDAILANLPQSGLRYYMPAWDVRTMLLKGGGMCGGWYLMFQALAGAQGVTVERRSYSVDWRVEAHDEARWCAIVVRHPGLNRKTPAEAASTFHDTDLAGVADGPVTEVTEPRYRFWGIPGGVLDGHCINFLQSDGRYYLYDASFMSESVALDDFELPVPDRKTRVSADALGTFRQAYLDRAVAFMLGSMHRNGHLYRTVHQQTGESVNGLSVLTSAIGDAGPGITFYWGP